MKKIDNDLITKRMNYYSGLKYPCINCGRKMPIRYDKQSVICSWCHDIIFRTEKEYRDYYKKQKFKKQLKRAMVNNELYKTTSNN